MLNESHLRAYQHLIIEHIIKVPKCAVWVSMGLGKTISTLTAIDRLLLAGAETKPVLVVAPLRVARDVWPNEIHEWSHVQTLRIVPILGTASQRMDALRLPADIFTINFENLEWLIETWGEHWPYGMIVIDESTKLKSLRSSIRKNEQGKEWVQGQGGTRAKALLKAVFQFKTTRLVELTGTPSPNGLIDLWGQLFFLDFGQRLGRVFDAFKNRWFRSSYDGYGSEALPTAQAEIETAVKDIVISLKSADWFDVAEPIVRNIKITLPPEARTKYREMEKQLFAEIAGHPIEAFNAGARTQKLLQFATGAAYIGNATDPGERKWVTVHDTKLDALEEIVEEWSGAPILVAYQFKSDLARLLKRFPKAKALDQQSKTLTDWNAGKIPMLLTHPASAGHGLSLQRGGNVLVYFSSGWNGEEDTQMAERIGPVRQAQSGLHRNVYYYRIVAENTLEEDVLESLKSKTSIQEALLNAMRRRG